MRSLPILLATVGVLFAQSHEPQPRPTTIRAIGEAAVPVRTGTATLRLAVNTTGHSGERARARNAEQSTGVINQLRDLLGTNANIRTAGYALTNSRDGYSASNMIEVQAPDAATEGKIIDLAARLNVRIAGNAEPSEDDAQTARAEALRLATIQARKNADAMAEGLGMHVVRVVSAEPETAAWPVVPKEPAGPSLHAEKRIPLPTPVEIGTQQIRARVAVTVEVAP